MRARGFSLVEFMIAMTIGLFLVGGLVYLIAETSRSRAEIERSSRQIENGRYALERLAEDIRHAGYFSEYFSVPAAGQAGFPASLTAASPCSIAIGTKSPPTELHAGMPLAVQAYDGGASLPSDLGGAGCTAAGLIAANYQPNTDILVVRRASTSTVCPQGKVCCAPLAGMSAPYQVTMTTDGGAVPITTSNAILTAAPHAAQPYVQTTAADFTLDLGGTAGAFILTTPKTNTTGTVDAPLRRYIVRIYFVARCNVPASGTTCNGTTDDGGASIPTLKMLELGVDPATGSGPTRFNLLPVAEGIEHLQFDFGIDNTGDGVADEVRECNSTTPCTAVQFSNVVTVQVNIVARNAETSPSYFDDKTYSLGLKGYTTATNDMYRRHAYSSLVRLNNIAMRRE